LYSSKIFENIIIFPYRKKEIFLSAIYFFERLFLANKNKKEAKVAPLGSVTFASLFY